MTRARLFVTIAASIALAAPGDALACACCTNPGQRYVEVLEQIESLRFAKEARLYATPHSIRAPSMR